MHPGIIFLGVIVGSVLFHIFTPWWWTDIASNWGAMDDTINLTFWIGGGVFILVCLFMVYCILKFSYKEGRKVEYKPEDHKLEKILTIATTLGVIALLAPGLIVYNNYVKHLVILIKFLLVYLFLGEAHRLELKYHLFHMDHLNLFQKDYHQ